MTASVWSVRSLRTKLVVSTVLLMAFAVALLSVAVQLVLNNLVSANVDRVLNDRAEAIVTAVDAAPPDRGHLSVPPGAIEGGVVVFDGSGTVVAGGLPEQWGDHAASLATTDRRRTVQIGEEVRVLAVPFRTDASLSGVVAVSERLAPYEQAETYALVATVVLGVVVTMGAGIMAARVTHRALAPVGEMSAQAVEWGDHDLEHRFDLGEPRDEITGLGAALDTLLDRVATALRAEQRLTSELAHELRTPLTTVQATADLALLNDDLDPELRADLLEIASSSRRMGATITALLDLARSSSSSAKSSSTTVGEVLDSAVPSPARVPSLTPDIAGADRNLRLGLPVELAVRSVAPVLENARHHAGRDIVVTTGASRTHVDIHIRNDGPPVSDADIDRIFDPGVTDTAGGAGLGLALARRIARSVGGDVFAEASLAGASFVVRLPRAVHDAEPSTNTGP